MRVENTKRGGVCREFFGSSAENSLRYVLEIAGVRSVYFVCVCGFFFFF